MALIDSIFNKYEMNNLLVCMINKMVMVRKVEVGEGEVTVRGSRRLLRPTLSLGRPVHLMNSPHGKSVWDRH